MKKRIRLLGLIFVGLCVALGVGWVGWHYSSSLPLPEVPLDGASQDVADAINQAEEEVRRQPRSGEAWGNLAMILAANGFPELALNVYEQAEKREPNNPAWPYLRGLELLYISPHESIPLFRSALGKSRASAGEHWSAILFRLVRLLIEDGQLEEADSLLRDLAKVEPDSPRLHYGRGLLAVARDDRPQAREHFKKVVDHPCGRQRACGFLAALAEDEAQKKLYEQRALELPADEDWPDPFLAALLRHKVRGPELMALYSELKSHGRRKEAIRALRQSVQETPGSENCYALAFELFEDGADEECAVAFRRALRYDPTNPKSHEFLGVALLRRGEHLSESPDDKEKALDLFRQALAAEDQALALQSNLGLAHLIRGRCLLHLGKSEEAIKALRFALLADPEIADRHMFLGEALAEAGQIPEALEHLQHAVELAKPPDPRPRRALEKWQAKAKESSK